MSPQNSLFDLMGQLEHTEPLLKLGEVFDWSYSEEQFTPMYSPEGRRSKPI